MTISYDDVIAAAPSVAETFDRQKVEELVALANAGFPDARFAHPKTGVVRPGTPFRGRVLYVLHMLNVPPVDLQASHIRRRMNLNNPKPRGKTPHPWETTHHGLELKKLVKN